MMSSTLVDVIKWCTQLYGTFSSTMLELTIVSVDVSIMLSAPAFVDKARLVSLILTLDA